MPNTHSTLTGLFSDIADAIREKTGGTDSIVADTFPEAISAIPAGGISVPSNDVDFIDYDGTIVYSYTAEEFAALTAMPDNPTHEGLTAQGWNWSLADAKSYVAELGELDIGQLYITDDGKTRLYITIQSEGWKTPTLRFYQAIANGVTIDWGDGSNPETLSGSGGLSVSHAYATIGEYVITLDPADECTLAIGVNGNGSTAVFEGGSTTQAAYRTILKKVEIGKNVTFIEFHSFYNCYSLRSITIPNTVANVYNYAFYECYELKGIVLPNNGHCGQYTFQNCSKLERISFAQGGYPSIYAFDGCRSLKRMTAYMVEGQYVARNCYALESAAINSGDVSNYAFRDCHSLRRFSYRTYKFASGSIGVEAFNSCYSLTSFTIHEKIESIGNSAFRYCYALKEVHVLPTTPPTIGTNVFGGAPSGFIIYVPQGTLSTYQSATNWSTYARYMQEEPS